MSAHGVTEEGAPGAPVALCVDLDGTLVATDTLWESLLKLVRERPADLLRLPAWLARGRAHTKRQLAGRVALAPETLPYRESVLALVREARRQGRPVWLATASDERVAEPIARHVGLFDAVIASDGRRNRAGGQKLAAVREALGDARFDYVGDSAADLPLWSVARTAYVVPGRRGILRRARAVCAPVFVDTPRPSRRAWLRALRPQQWIKNVLLFAPLALAHQGLALERVGATALAFAAFCLCASGGYVVNDLLDLEADRRHPRKRTRPFAAGALSIPAGITLVGALVAGGLGLAGLWVGPAVAGLLALYLVLTLSYSLWLKELLFLDVLVLSGLYAHRVVTGGFAAEVPVSPWLLAFSLFFFVSLAFVKRFCELRQLAPDAAGPLRRRNYRREDIEMIRSLGPASGYLSVLVLALYITSSDITRLYATPQLLWWVCPVLLYWLTRVWLLAGRGELPDDPVLFAATDPHSYLAVAAIAVVGVWAAL